VPERDFKKEKIVKHLTASDALDLLANEFNLSNQSKLAEFMRLTSSRISQIKSLNKVNKNLISSFIRAAFRFGCKKGRSEINGKLFDAFQELRGITTQTQVAINLNKSQGAVAQWRQGQPISQGVISNILKTANLIKIEPLLEMVEIEPGKPGGKWYLFHDKNNTRRNKILRKIENHCGTYCYYDGRGHLTYIGKADRTPLHIEVENRLNAKIAKYRIPYGENLKKSKHITQGKIVRYVSAYKISPKEAIPLIEALLIRATSNIQYNNRLENLS
jgi:hypothetical protein